MLVKKCDGCKGEEKTWPPGWIEISAEEWDNLSYDIPPVNGDYCSFECAIKMFSKALEYQSQFTQSKQ